MSLVRTGAFVSTAAIRIDGQVSGHEAIKLGFLFCMTGTVELCALRWPAAQLPRLVPEATRLCETSKALETPSPTPCNGLRSLRASD